MEMFNPIIKKANSFFQLDVQKIIGRGSYLLGSQAVSNALSFLVAIAAAHFLSKETYGTYRYILSTVGFIGAFSLTGLSTAIIRNTARGYDSLFDSSVRRSMLWSLPSIFAGVGASAWYLWNGNFVLGLSIGIGSILFPVVQSLLLFRSFLNGKEYFKALMISNIAYSFVTSISILVAILLTKSTIILAIVYYVSNLIITFILNQWVRKKFTVNKESDPTGGKLENHISLMNILDIGATQLDKIILFQIGGPIEVARYVYATIIPEQLRNVVKYTSTLSMPIFSSLPKSTAKSKGLFLSKKLFLITIPLVIFYYFVTPFLYKLFFPNYIEVVGYSQLFGLILLFDGGINGTVLKAQNEVKKLYLVTMTSNISKVVLLVILGVTMGISGIVLSRVASRAISFFASYISVKKIKDA